MKPKVRKAVFPVAGLGTRFLPATKATPKEMLPVVDKPLIQYAVEEALEAGITDLVFVTGRTKRSIEDHFDRAPELETELETRGKHDLLEQVRDILPERAACSYVRQTEALGLGHAVLCAKLVIGDEPFAVILPDDLIYGGTEGATSQMAAIYREHECSVLAVETIAPADSDKYGVVKAVDVRDRVSQVEDIVEKPVPAEAPSNLGVVGRYILTPRIFEMLEQTTPGSGGEIQLTDAIQRLLAHERVLAFRFTGKRFDCGSKLGYLQATVELALKHPELKDGFRAFLATVLSEQRDLR
ncbi:MAG: UTP--glucose-1-phosphate uridylyltransferase GalU [Gammaproteobacteria bacterium]|nr:UTP--glucose-1-phosphate uridylyltransferase GalU [Gammaproteobacteria bacterium]